MNSNPFLDHSEVRRIVVTALSEDIGSGDHTSLATIPREAVGTAKLLVKEAGVVAGVELAALIFGEVDPALTLTVHIPDGSPVKKGDVVFHVAGFSRSILTAERLVLNFMQRMSGIATQTHHLTELISHTPCKLLDTRKTTPGIRTIEKWAVRIGGGTNHRQGLYDMILIKDNHIDYSGGIPQAIQRTQEYLLKNKLDLKIEIEARSIEDVKSILLCGNVHRILLDNFTTAQISEALKIIDRKKYETEASGGITEKNIVAYAETGVDFISSGMLTHSVKSLDLSLKAVPPPSV